MTPAEKVKCGDEGEWKFFKKPKAARARQDNVPMRLKTYSKRIARVGGMRKARAAGRIQRGVAAIIS
jgi:hypothetical protein